MKTKILHKDEIDASARICRAELPEGLIQRIEKLKDVFNEVCPRSLDEWIEGFRADMHPEREIAIWEKMAERFEQLCKKRRAGTETERRQIFREVFERSLREEPIRVSKKEIPTA